MSATSAVGMTDFRPRPFRRSQGLIVFIKALHLKFASALINIIAAVKQALY